MGKSLIITEKPSVAQEFAKVLRVSGRNDGYIENGEYVISWCVGHLVGLVYPESYDMKYKKWRLEDLPFLPKEYKYDVIDSVRKQYNIVHALLQREDIDRVYWAGDAGKEGQTIEENIRNFGGVSSGKLHHRVLPLPQGLPAEGPNGALRQFSQLLLHLAQQNLLFFKVILCSFVKSHRPCLPF